MPEIYGIDVSKYQKVIDWRKVKESGKQFVFVRLGWVGYDGSFSVDAMADRNIRGAAADGLNVGVYVYSYCTNPLSAKTAAVNTLAAIKKYEPLAYPVAFDIEDTSTAGTPYNTYGKALNNSIVKAFLNAIGDAGYYGMLYTYKSFAENYLDMKDLSGYDVWIAQYADKCGYAGKYGIWQYAGDKGVCPGVATACDLNIAYKDYAAIIKSAGLNGYKKEEEQPGSEILRLKSENESLCARIKILEEKLEKITALIKAS